MTAIAELLFGVWKESSSSAERSRLEETLHSLEALLGSFPITDERAAAYAFARAFDQLLSQAGEEDATSFNRLVAGAYFTPRSLIDPILDHALAPVLSESIRRACFPECAPLALPPIHEWPEQTLARAREVLFSLRILDPACGPATFLLPVADRLLANHLALGSKGDGKLRFQIARHSLVGIELHPAIAKGARLALWLWAGRPSGGSSDFSETIRVGDSFELLKSPPRSADNLFDVSVGNPPFANAIEAKVATSSDKGKGRRSAFAELTGTADLSYYFLALADQWTKEEGAVGLVLPRAILNARSARGLRARLTTSRPPALLYAPPDPLLFERANVSVVALVLRRGAVCWASRDLAMEGKNPDFKTVEIRDANWWRPLEEGATRLLSARGRRLADEFDVWGSMTAGMAYDLMPFVVEEEEVPRPRGSRAPVKLLTTGLIDPGVSLWGTKVCRYLKRKVARPVIDPHRALPPSLAARVALMGRPKVIVGGLSNRVEAMLDANKEFLGAVSTYSIFHPSDDLRRLEELVRYLSTPEVTTHLRQELGATALSGGRITLTKEFLQQLPIPF